MAIRPAKDTFMQDEKKMQLRIIAALNKRGGSMGTRDLARSLQSSMRVGNLRKNLAIMVDAKTIDIHRSKRSNGIGIKFTVSITEAR